MVEEWPWVVISGSHCHKQLQAVDVKGILEEWVRNEISRLVLVREYEQGLRSYRTQFLRELQSK